MRTLGPVSAAAERGAVIALSEQLWHLCWALIEEVPVEARSCMAAACAMAAQCACFPGAVLPCDGSLGETVTAFSGAQQEWSAIAKANAGADDTAVTTSNNAIAHTRRIKQTECIASKRVSGNSKEPRMRSFSHKRIFGFAGNGKPTTGNGVGGYRLAVALRVTVEASWRGGGCTIFLSPDRRSGSTCLASASGAARSIPVPRSA
jgi:hypothetical protein